MLALCVMISVVVPSSALAVSRASMTRIPVFESSAPVGSSQSSTSGRFAIARALAKKPDVLLCDEPTGALDSKTGIRVVETLLKVNSELGTTTLIITHNAAIQAVAHRVLSFADGRISGVHHNETRVATAELSW